MIDWEDRLIQLLKVVGSPAKCKGCGADILWVTTRHGKVTPYKVEGVNHFADCPKAHHFRKIRKGVGGR